MAVLGTVKLVAYGFTPRGWAPCDGQLLPISQNTALFSLLGTTYGGDGRSTFGLPNLQSRVPIHTAPTHRQGSSGGAPMVNLGLDEMPQHTHTVMATGDPASQTQPDGNTFGTGGRAPLYAPNAAGSSPETMNQNSVTATGGGQAHDNMQPSLGLQYVICLYGDYPSRNGGGSLPDDGEAYLADVKAYAFNFAPRGWAACDGQILDINSNQSLYSLLGTTYGGDGRATFALPDLRGRAAVGQGDLNGVRTSMGEKMGAETVTLTEGEIPNHTHAGQFALADASETSPAGNLTRTSPTDAGPYTSGDPDRPMDSSVIGAPPVNNQPHDNMMPFLAVNYCICMQGLFPSRN